MRLAVLSDIHGNAVALEAVLDDLAQRPADSVVCLGDAIQGGPQPAEVVARLRALGCPVVMGNADAWLLSGVETGAEPITEERRARMEAVRLWSLERLSDADREFIAAFRATVSVALGGERSFLGYHGSPASFDDIILPDTAGEAFDRMLGPHARHVLAGGHVHLQFVRRIGDSFHFNPGSVGLAYAHGQTGSFPRLDPWAEYAMLTAENGRTALEFRRVPVDVEAVVEAYRRGGSPSAEVAERAYARR